MRHSNKAPSRVFSKGNFVLVYPYPLQLATEARRALETTSHGPLSGRSHMLARRVEALAGPSHRQALLLGLPAVIW